LEVFARKASHLSPPELLKSFESNAYVRPSALSVPAVLEVDRILYSLASPSFEPVELSPLAPLGVCSALATVHQNKVLSTVRNTEVLSDCTNVLALLCATRRRNLLAANSKNAGRIKLCTSQRHVRCQPLPDPRFLRHFRLFALCTAGRDEGDFIFELESIREHLDFYLRVLSVEDAPYAVPQMEVLLTLLDQESRKDAIQDAIMRPLCLKFPSVRIDFYPERETGRGYYQDLCFHVNAWDASGDYFNLADGGFTDWTARVLNNHKERLLISAIGTERLCWQFLKITT
jgi:hypothetical protein